jgi:hypothetical protein
VILVDCTSPLADLVQLQIDLTATVATVYKALDRAELELQDYPPDVDDPAANRRRLGLESLIWAAGEALDDLEARADKVIGEAIR